MLDRVRKSYSHASVEKKGPMVIGFSMQIRIKMKKKNVLLVLSGSTLRRYATGSCNNDGLYH